jgi:hypothetical protein
VRTAKEDIALLADAGVWNGHRDPLLNAVVLLCMYAKGRHKPLRHLHKLANAVEDGDTKATQKYYGRLDDEVSMTLRKYPDIVETLESMSQLSDDEVMELDRLMQQYE